VAEEEIKKEELEENQENQENQKNLEEQTTSEIPKDPEEEKINIRCLRRI